MFKRTAALSLILVLAACNSTPALSVSKLSLNDTPSMEAAPTVSIMSSSVSRATLTAGQVQSASVTLTATTALQGLIVDIRIYRASDNSMFATKNFSPVNLSAGVQLPLTFDYSSPLDMPPGQYDIQVGVWDTSWKTYLYETRDSFTVGGQSSPLYCQDGDRPSSGSYMVENNQWGKDGVTGGFSQCVAMTGAGADGSVSALWTWTWPSGPNEVKGYPAIVFGQKPGYSATPQSNLPIRLDVATHVTTSWATRGAYTGQGQLTFDLWLTRDGVPHDRFVDTPITHEIMVTLESYGGYGLDRNPAWFVEERTINGVDYKIYKADGFGTPPQTWRFLVFQVQGPMTQGSLEFKPLFDYLKTQGFIQGNEYLASIELGSEAVEGSGAIFVDAFKATVN